MSENNMEPREQDMTDIETRREMVLLDGNLRALLTLHAEAPDPDVTTSLAAALNARADHDWASRIAREGLKTSPDHGGLWWERVRARPSYQAAIRDWLRDVPEVAEVESGGDHEGGNGVTIATLAH